MVARTDRRLGTHASLPRLSHTSSGAPRYFMGVPMMLSRPVCRADLHATQWGAPGVWSHPVRRAVIPRTHDPRNPVRVSMMSSLVVSSRGPTIHATPRGCPMMSGLVPWSSSFSQAPMTPWGVHDVWSCPVRRAVSPPAMPTPTSGAHQECFQPTAPPPGVLLSTAKRVSK